MSDRVVYLVDEVTKLHTTAAVAFVDDAGLSQLLADGYEITTTLEGRKVKAGTKSVTATMLVLRPSGENRGVSSRESGYHRDEEGRNLVTVNDEYGMPRQMTPAQAMTREMTRALGRIGDVGHLGSARDHSMPGMTIISGELVGKAFDAGTIAASRGDPESANPFPAGSAPHTRWIEGYRKYHASAGAIPEAGSAALTEAELEGYGLAQALGPKDQAHCPYLRGNPLREAWMNGFVRGGGTIENA